MGNTIKRNYFWFALAFVAELVFSSSAQAATLEGFGMEDAVIKVADTAGKAVVSISSEKTTRIGTTRRFYYRYPHGGDALSGQEEFFQKFFDDFFGPMPYQEFKQRGLGSGVIIDPEGYILTNEHVISGAEKITVTLADGREFIGEVRGRDMRSDLAVIKIDARNLPAASLGDSDTLKIGQWVVAIGNPFGFALTDPEPTVTVGVISAMHRSLGQAPSRYSDYSDLLQTDAAINPGNSGGPLVNLKGEVVGINVAIFSTSGGYQGVGFAVPINSAKRIIDQLIAEKKITYGWLGIAMQDLNEDLVSYFGLADKNGVVVVKVLEGGPAQKGGLREGDVITEFQGVNIKKGRELLGTVAKTEVGEKVKLTIIRDKKMINREVVIEQRPDQISQGPTQEQGPGESDEALKPWRGLEVEDAASLKTQRSKIAVKNGVVVVRVEPSSPAETAGIIAGDVIIEISRQPVASISDFRKATRSVRGAVLMKTSRGYFILKEKTVE